MVSPSAQAAAIDNIGYSSIRAADKLLLIVIPFNFEDFTNILQTKAGWRKFTGGFFIGALGGTTVAYLLLSQI